MPAEQYAQLACVLVHMQAIVIRQAMVRASYKLFVTTMLVYSAAMIPVYNALGWRIYGGVGSGPAFNLFLLFLFDLIELPVLWTLMSSTKRSFVHASGAPAFVSLMTNVYLTKLQLIMGAAV